MSESGGHIFQAIPAIMAELGAIGRNQKNVQQNFKYRGIDDLYNAIQPLLAKHSVFTSPEVIAQEHKTHTTRSGSVQNHVILTVKYTFYGKDGSNFSATVVGEGMDSFDKASNKAESVAHKYALTQVFAVRTEDQIDPDGETPEPRALPPRPQPTPLPEFDRVEDEERGATMNDPNDPGTFVFNLPKFKGKRLKDIPRKDLVSYLNYMNSPKAGPLSNDGKKLLEAASRFLGDRTEI